MAGPHYLHPDPDSVPVRETFTKARIDVDATKMTGLPSLNTLHDSVLGWLRSYLGANANFAKDFNPAGPGKVLIVAHGKAEASGTYPFSAVESAEVLNGNVLQASYHRPYQTWRNDNQRTLNADPKKLAKAQNLRPADYQNYVWDFDGGLTANSCPAGQGGANNGWTDKDNQVIYINAHCDDGSVLVHEFFHAVEGLDQNQTDFGNPFDEGIVDFFSRDVSKACNYSYKGNIAYNGGYMAAKDIVDHLDADGLPGLPFLCRLWFVRPKDWLKDLGPKANAIAEKRPFILTAQQAASLADVRQLVEDFCALARPLVRAALNAGQLPQVPAPAQPAAPLPPAPAAVHPAAPLPPAPAAVQPARKWAVVSSLKKPFRSGG